MLTTQDHAAPTPGFTAVGTREPDPDAELLALGARFLALLTAGRDLHDEAFDPIGDEMAVIERELETLTATTLEGVAVLLRVGFLRSGYGNALEDRYVHGRASDDPPVALDPVLWRALVSIERRTGVPDGGREGATP
jgi:hypothetical protein